YQRLPDPSPPDGIGFTPRPVELASSDRAHGKGAAMQKGIRLILAGLVAATIVAVTQAAFASTAKHGNGVEKSGTCSASSTWKLKAKPDNGKLEVEFEVDQNVSGDTWNVRLKDNGMVFFKGQRVTRDPSGSFEVRRLTANLDGTDMISARAANQSTGEVCRAALKI